MRGISTLLITRPHILTRRRLGRSNFRHQNAYVAHDHVAHDARADHVEESWNPKINLVFGSEISRIFGSENSVLIFGSEIQ